MDVKYNGPGVLDEDGRPKGNGTYDAFETLTSLLVENGYSYDLFYEEDNILYIGDDAIIVKKDPIVVNGFTEDVVIVSLSLDTHPIFVLELTELLINTCVNYTIGECFLYYPETYEVIFESEIEIAECLDCSKVNQTEKKMTEGHRD